MVERALRKALSAVGHDGEATSSTSLLYCPYARDVRLAAHGAGETTRALKISDRSAKSEVDQLLQGTTEAIKRGFLLTEDGESEVGEGVFMEQLARDEFRRVRELWGISEADYLPSLGNLEGGLTQESGKSGSLFWFSADGRYILKSATQKEVSKLLAILPRYIGHLKASQDVGRPSLLPRFFGAYSIRAGAMTLSIVIMNNLFEGPARPSRIYDLKGTTEDRFVEPAPGKVMKDLNFVAHEICIDAEPLQRLLVALEEDTTFLESEGIMDYSLLLGVYEDHIDAGATRTPCRAAAPCFQGVEVVLSTDEMGVGSLPSSCCISSRHEEDLEEEPSERRVSVRVGIIDVLVEYGFRKKVAHWMKKLSIGLWHEIDTEPPPYYQRRFVGRMEDIFNEIG